MEARFYLLLLYSKVTVAVAAVGGMPGWNSTLVITYVPFTAAPSGWANSEDMTAWPGLRTARSRCARVAERHPAQRQDAAVAQAEGAVVQPGAPGGEIAAPAAASFAVQQGEAAQDPERPRMHHADRQFGQRAGDDLAPCAAAAGATDAR